MRGPLNRFDRRKALNFLTRFFFNFMNLRMLIFRKFYIISIAFSIENYEHLSDKDFPPPPPPTDYENAAPLFV